MEQYLTCSISNNFCKHQRYCITKEAAINTDGSENCDVKQFNKKKTYAKKQVIDVNKNEVVPAADTNEEVVQIETTLSNVPNKKIAVVTLVTKRYVVYDLDGNSVCLRGKYNYSIGDKIEV